MAELTVETVPVESLELHPANARQGDVGAISESLRLHGLYKPIVVQRSTQQVLAGNHTLLAARALGWETIDTVQVDVDDDEALRILLVDNRANDLASYDERALRELLEEMARTPKGLEGTGYDGDALDEMLLALNVLEGFAPGDSSDNPRLDEKVPIVCPECGHEWTR